MTLCGNFSCVYVWARRNASGIDQTFQEVLPMGLPRGAAAPEVPVLRSGFFYAHRDGRSPKALSVISRNSSWEFIEGCHVLMSTASVIYVCLYMYIFQGMWQCVSPGCMRKRHVIVWSVRLSHPNNIPSSPKAYLVPALLLTLPTSITCLLGMSIKPSPSPPTSIFPWYCQAQG